IAGLSDETGFPHQGVINFSDNKLDPNTGTLRVRASIANPKPRVLSPGLFMRIRLPVGKPHKALLVPEQAVLTEQGQKSLFVVDDKKKVQVRQITVGRLNEGKRVVEEGLKDNEWVIVTGLQRVRATLLVDPKPAAP